MRRAAGRAGAGKCGKGSLPIAHCADRARVSAGEDGGIRDGGVVKEVAIRAVGRAVGRAMGRKVAVVRAAVKKGALKWDLVAAKAEAAMATVAKRPSPA